MSLLPTFDWIGKLASQYDLPIFKQRLQVGEDSFCQRITIRRGGSISKISPVSNKPRSGWAIFQEAPFFQSHSTVVSNWYWRMSCESVSAFQSLPGVVRMYVTYTKRLRFA